MTENKIPYEEGWIILDKKQYWFMKRSAADVRISDDNGGDYILTLLDLETLRILI